MQAPESVSFVEGFCCEITGSVGFILWKRVSPHGSKCERVTSSVLSPTAPSSEQFVVPHEIAETNLNNINKNINNKNFFS